MAYSLLFYEPGRMLLEDYAYLWSSWLTGPGSSHSHTPLK